MKRAGTLALMAGLLVALGVACSDEDAVATNPAVDGGADGSLQPTALCPNGKAVDWPPEPYGFGTLETLPPDLTFSSPEGPIRLRDYFEPCAAQSRVLVVRTSAAWCGSCSWHAEKTGRMLGDGRFGDRVLVLDLLVADEDNMPANADALARWRTKIGAVGKVGIDPSFVFAPATTSKAPLPVYAFVDTKTMTVRTGKGDPSPELLQNTIALELALLDGLPRPELLSPKREFGELLQQNHADLLRGMKLAGSPTPDPTNEYGDVPAAAALGKQLFSDGALVSSGVSCAKCHDATRSLADGLPQSVGVAKVDRNSPAIALSASARWQFWDGRADTLWAQALGPPEDGKEMASNRLYIAHQVKARYAAEYAAVFGAKYPLPANLDSLPENGKPGDPAFDALPQADRDAVTRIYVNVGKAIAAYERTIRVKPNALDRFIDGDLGALTKLQQRALGQFFDTGCHQCHWGPRLTDDAFHVVRFPTGRQDGMPDRGRFEVLPGLAKREFNAASKWSDAPSAAKLLNLDQAPTMLGAFKTPSIRGVASSAPYGHGGTFAKLLEVSQHYGTRAKDVSDARAVGVLEPWLPEFDANVQGELPALLEVLTADVEP